MAPEFTVCDGILECKRVCLGSTQVSVCFPLCSLNFWGCNPPFFPKPSPLPPSYPAPPHTCGPGGAGACSPEDRGSAGSQKHLSVPFPLCPNAPGTALNSAPGASECVFKERRLEKNPKLPEWSRRGSECCAVRAWVCFSLPLNTPLWVWLQTHGLLHMAAAPRHPQSCQHRKLLPLPGPNPTRPKPHPQQKL